MADPLDSTQIQPNHSNRFSLSFFFGPMTNPTDTYWLRVTNPTLSPSPLRLSYLEFSSCGLSAKPTDIDPLFLVAVVCVPDNGSGQPAFTPTINIANDTGITFYAPPSDLVTVFFVSPSDGYHQVTQSVDLRPMTHVFLGVRIFVTEALNEFYVALVMNGNVSYL
jgi:hypothetical protein